jgi:hypothetical protein
MPNFCPMEPGKPCVGSLFGRYPYSNSMVAPGFALLCSKHRRVLHRRRLSFIFRHKDDGLLVLFRAD